MKKGPKPKKEKLINDLLGKVSTQEWLEFANVQRGKLVKEVEHLGKEIVAKIGDAPIFANREQLIQEAKHNIEGLLHRLNQSELITKVSKVIDSAWHGKYDVLGFLNIPSKHDLIRLERKLSKLEARLEHVGHPSREQPPSA